mmetsp:Transcript_42929/g.106826  ORF Transcript_42929/g.106826 Transcript_42929/m.106826 type:complete len:130 (-) Transcript_42929:1637-2026(-)
MAVVAVNSGAVTAAEATAMAEAAKAGEATATEEASRAPEATATVEDIKAGEARATAEASKAEEEGSGKVAGEVSQVPLAGEEVAEVGMVASERQQARRTWSTSSAVSMASLTEPTATSKGRAMTSARSG